MVEKNINNNSIRTIMYPSVRERYGTEIYMRYKHTINKKIKYKMYETIKIGQKIYNKNY